MPTTTTSNETENNLTSRVYKVQELLDQWYGVGYQCFKVRADDENLYILRHNTGEDLWVLDSFRSDKT